MPHYYYLDHSKQMSSGQSESSDHHPAAQHVPFQCSSEILNGNFFLLGQSVWIICQLLGKRERSVEKTLRRIRSISGEIIDENGSRSHSALSRAVGSAETEFALLVDSGSNSTKRFFSMFFFLVRFRIRRVINTHRRAA